MHNNLKNQKLTVMAIAETAKIVRTSRICISQRPFDMKFSRLWVTLYPEASKLEDYPLYSIQVCVMRPDTHTYVLLLQKSKIIFLNFYYAFCSK